MQLIWLQSFVLHGRVLDSVYHILCGCLRRPVKGSHSVGTSSFVYLPCVYFVTNIFQIRVYLEDICVVTKKFILVYVEQPIEKSLENSPNFISVLFQSLYHKTDLHTSGPRFLIKPKAAMMRDMRWHKKKPFPSFSLHFGHLPVSTYHPALSYDTAANWGG